MTSPIGLGSAPPDASTGKPAERVRPAGVPPPPFMSTDEEANAAWRKYRQHLFRTRSQLERLETNIEAAQPRIAARQELLDAAPPAPAKVDVPNAKAHLSLASSLLCKAEHALSDARPDGGWALLHAALEAEVVAYTDPEVEATSLRLKTEARGEYLSGSSATAVENLLAQVTTPRCHAGSKCGPECPAPGLMFGPVARDCLRQALEVRNEFFENMYTAIRVNAHRRILLLGMGIVLLVAAASLIWGRPTDGDVISHEGFVAAAVSVAGMLGAVTSAIQRLAANPTASIPAELDSLTATLTRPFIGVVGALTTYFSYQSGLLHFSTATPVSFLLLVSFGVGFTERLVVYNPQQQAK
jgi:hypothetical protein